MSPGPRGMGTWIEPSIAQVGEEKTDALVHPFFLVENAGGFLAPQVTGRSAHEASEFLTACVFESFVLCTNLTMEN